MYRHSAYICNIAHLLTNCNNVQKFWQDINSWLSWVSNFQIHFKPVSVLVGVTDKESYVFQKNFILLTTKKYIFLTSHKRKQLNIFEYQSFLT